MKAQKNPKIFLNTHRNKFRIVRNYSAVMPEPQKGGGGQGGNSPPPKYLADQLTLFQQYLHVLSRYLYRAGSNLFNVVQ